MRSTQGAQPTAALLGIALAVVLAAVVLAIWACGVADEPSEDNVEPRSQVVLIGLDGASWNVLDPLLEAGKLPNLDHLRQRGVTARLEAVEPIISPSVWTSLATGRRPDVHGIKNFFATSENLRWPTIWQRVARQGHRVGLYDFLLTWPPVSLPEGFVIPGWLRRDDAITPDDAFERAAAEPYRYRLLIDSPEAVRETVDREMTHKAGTFRRLREAFELDLGVVTFYSIDLVSHRFWHTYRPEDFDQAPPVSQQDRDIVRETVIRADRAVGEIVDRLGPEVTVLLASDHGFKAQPDVFRQWTFRNELFDLAGIDLERDGVEVHTQWQQLQLRITRGDETERDASIDRLRTFFAGIHTSGGQPIFRTDAFHVPMRPDEINPRRPARLVETAESDPTTYAWLSVLRNRQALNPLSSEEQVEVAGRTLPLSRILYSEPLSGDHDPIGVFFAAGRGIRALPERADLSVLDLAPLIIYLLGEAIPDDLEGVLPVDLLEPALLRAQRPKLVESQLTALDGLTAPADEDAAADPENEELVRRLRALGYLD